MVDYIGVSDIQYLVHEIGTANFIARLAQHIEADFKRWPDFEKSARVANHSADGVIELMPISDSHQYSFKYVNGHPKNANNGLLTVTAFGVLADVSTGYPLLLSELTVTTALRTAATSCLVARHLARPGSRVMALIGNGAQSEFQAIAFYEMLGIRELRLYDPDSSAMAKLERNLRCTVGLDDLTVTRMETCQEAVNGADIITTVTADKANAKVLTPSMIKPGMHINAVGGDCPGKTELHPAIFELSGVQVFVEYEPQSRQEGEIQQLAPDYPVTEFAEVLRGSVGGRESEAGITIFDSVGFALEDYSALRFLHTLLGEYPTRRRGIDLIPDVENPKDLFGGTLGGKQKSRVRRAA